MWLRLLLALGSSSCEILYEIAGNGRDARVRECDEGSWKAKGGKQKCW